MDYDKNYIEVAYNPKELNEIFISFTTSNYMDYNYLLVISNGSKLLLTYKIKG